MRIMQKKYVIPGLIVCLALAGYLTLRISTARTFQFYGKLVSRVATNDKVVALTFDDAPRPETTREILNLLEAKHVQATFYVVGQAAEKYPASLTAIVENGHELGNHSYSHRRMVFKSQEFIQAEVEKTNQLIRNSGYAGEITFRPPYGKKFIGLPWYLAKRNIKTIMWEIEPDTYYPGKADSIAQYTLDHVKPGAIILLHPFGVDSGKADREAMEKIIDSIIAQGYRFVTISQLLKHQDD